MPEEIDEKEKPSSFWKTHGLLGIITASSVVLAALIAALAAIVVPGHGSTDSVASPAQSFTATSSPPLDSSTQSVPLASTQPPSAGSPQSAAATEPGQPGTVRLSVSPASGPPGSDVIVTGTGLIASEYAIMILLGSGAGTFATGNADDGTIHVLLQVPDSALPGTDTIEVANVDQSVLAT